jgi:hypothetical protein
MSSAGRGNKEAIGHMVMVVFLSCYVPLLAWLTLPDLNVISVVSFQMLVPA